MHGEDTIECPETFADWYALHHAHAYAFSQTYMIWATTLSVISTPHHLKVSEMLKT